MKRINLTVSDPTYALFQAFADEHGIKSVAGAVQFLALAALKIQQDGIQVEIAPIEDQPEWGGKREKAGRRKVTP